MRRQDIRALAKGLLFLAPAIALLFMFTVIPVVRTLDMSFYASYNYFKDIVIERGLDCYKYLFSDRDFYTAIKNTFAYVIGVVPASLILSLLIAFTLNARIPFKKFFQTVYFIPFVTSTVAISLVWNWIFHTDFGLINWGLGFLGIDPIRWLADPRWTMTSMIILGVWKNLGYNIMILIAALQSIDSQYHAASRIDGASAWQRATLITIPLMSPTIFFVSVITLIESFKVFDQVYAMFGKSPGPLNSCLTMVYYIFEKFYNQFHYGVASAAVVVFYVIILVLNVIQFRLGRKHVHY